MKLNTPLMLIILDGWGINPRKEANAIALANTPTMDYLISSGPHTQLQASGESVGLPDGQMGNSEVGHLNLGAGRIVYQELTRINKSIRNGTFFKNTVLISAFEETKLRSSSLHLMGLVSDGGVHSHIEHLFALIKMAKDIGIKDINIHCFMDGRDTPPKIGHEYIKDLQNFIDGAGVGKIATVIGRYYAMDRDKRWERVEKAYRAITLGEGRFALSGMDAINMAYNKGETDEFVVPTVIVDSNSVPLGLMKDGDIAIAFNFRADRVREISRALNEIEFRYFKRDYTPHLARYICMTQYDETFNFPIAFPPDALLKILGETISSKNMAQLRIAETEKYAHVTFFFNGGEEKPYNLENRCLIPSPKVATYDLQPEMSAVKVTDEVIKHIEIGEEKFIVLNFANPDMVGHTGILSAAIKACEVVDICLGRIMDSLKKVKGRALITADHGNAEEMIDYKTGEPHTAHTSNPVPLIYFDLDNHTFGLREGILADVAPTLLELMEVEQPSEMTGNSLLIHK